MGEQTKQIENVVLSLSLRLSSDQDFIYQRAQNKFAWFCCYGQSWLQGLCTWSTILTIQFYV